MRGVQTYNRERLCKTRAFDAGNKDNNELVDC